MLPLLLLACSDNGLTPYRGGYEDTHNAGSDSSDTGEGRNDLPLTSPCDISQYSVSVGDGAFVNWESFCPTVLEDGSYGERGEYASDCDVKERNNNILTNAPDIFAEDASLADLAGLLDCSADLTFLMATYRSHSQFNISRIWTTLGYHKGEVSDPSAIIFGEEELPLANIAATTSTSQFGGAQMQIGLAAAGKAAESHNTNTVSNIAPPHQSLRINDNTYTPNVPDYTIAPATTMIEYAAQLMFAEFSYLSASADSQGLCREIESPSEEIDNAQWCELYLTGTHAR